MNQMDLNVFDYNNYREFLADFYEAKKARNPNYSHRMFSKRAGLSSPSYLLMTIKGERNLSLKTVPKFTKGLGLKAKEQRYFELLVLYNQTDELQEKARLFSELMMLKAGRKSLHSLEKERFDFLSKWYVVATYVLVEIDGFSDDADWIQKRLGGRISKPQAKFAIDTLLKLKLIEKTEDGKYRQASGAITVADDTRSIAVFNYHQSMIRLANEALVKCDLNNREMNGATIPISKDQLPLIKEKIRAFRKEINQLASSSENPEDVYQLNIQLFPLTTADSEIGGETQ